MRKHLRNKYNETFFLVLGAMGTQAVGYNDKNINEKKVPSHWGYGDPMCESNDFEFEKASGLEGSNSNTIIKANHGAIGAT